MDCSAFDFDAYAQHALGLAGYSDQADLERHLKGGCADCLGSLREALLFWLAFAARTGLPQGLEPSRDLKDRIMLAVGEPLGFWPSGTPWTAPMHDESELMEMSASADAEKYLIFR